MPPEEGPLSQATLAQTQNSGPYRQERPGLVGFLSDDRSETVIREALAGPGGEPLDLRRGGIRAAIAAMHVQATPRVLIVDVGGEEQPLSALGELAQTVEPDVLVLVVGEVDHADFYREITRGMGAAEYLSKPLTPDKILRHFGPFLRGGPLLASSVLRGRAIAVTGVRGGVGATTVAANLAWHLGVTMRRHTCLLDPDIHMGAAAFLLNVRLGPGLRMALEAPDRIDSLLAERAAQPVADRLHVLASEEKLSTEAMHGTGAAAALMSALRSRYNFIVLDLPPDPIPLYRELLDLVDQRVFVMEPSLVGIRDIVRLLSLPKGPAQQAPPMVVMNRTGRPGGLDRRQVEQALKIKIDVVVPDVPQQAGNAAALGDPVILKSHAFRAGIISLANQVAAVSAPDGGPRGRKSAAAVARAKRAAAAAAAPPPRRRRETAKAG